MALDMYDMGQPVVTKFTADTTGFEEGIKRTSASASQFTRSSQTMASQFTRSSQMMARDVLGLGRSMEAFAREGGTMSDKIGGLVFDLSQLSNSLGRTGGAAGSLFAIISKAAPWLAIASAIGTAGVALYQWITATEKAKGSTEKLGTTIEATGRRILNLTVLTAPSGAAAVEEVKRRKAALDLINETFAAEKALMDLRRTGIFIAPGEEDGGGKKSGAPRRATKEKTAEELIGLAGFGQADFERAIKGTSAWIEAQENLNNEQLKGTVTAIGYSDALLQQIEGMKIVEAATAQLGATSAAAARGGMATFFTMLFQGKSGAAAFKEMTKQIIQAIGVQSAIEGVVETAKGFGALIWNPPLAAAHFKSAGLHFAAASMAGIAAAAIGGTGPAGGGGGGGGGARALGGGGGPIIGGGGRGEGGGGEEPRPIVIQLDVPPGWEAMFGQTVIRSIDAHDRDRGTTTFERGG